MEQLNYVHLKGYVGSIRLVEGNTASCLVFSVATNLAYKMKDGSPVIETTWNPCCAFQGERIDTTIQKGDAVELEGRLRNRRYVDAEGNSRDCYDILVSSLKKLDTQNEPLQTQL